jgi:hypothetical protein
VRGVKLRTNSSLVALDTRAIVPTHVGVDRENGANDHNSGSHAGGIAAKLPTMQARKTPTKYTKLVPTHGVSRTSPAPQSEKTKRKARGEWVVSEILREKVAELPATKRALKNTVNGVSIALEDFEQFFGSPEKIAAEITQSLVTRVISSVIDEMNLSDGSQAIHHMAAMVDKLCQPPDDSEAPSGEITSMDASHMPLLLQHVAVCVARELRSPSPQALEAAERAVKEIFASGDPWAPSFKKVVRSSLWSAFSDVMRSHANLLIEEELSRLIGYAVRCPYDVSRSITSRVDTALVAAGELSHTRRSSDSRKSGNGASSPANGKRRKGASLLAGKPTNAKKRRVK